MAAIEVHGFKLPPDWRERWERGDGFWMVRVNVNGGLERFRGVARLPGSPLAIVDVHPKENYAYINGREKLAVSRYFLKLYGGACFFEGQPLEEGGK